MPWHTVRRLICGFWLAISALAAQSTPALTQTLPPPAARPLPPRNTPLPQTVTMLPAPVTPTTIPANVISAIDATLTQLARQKRFSGAILIGRQGTVLLSQGYGWADRQQQRANTAKTRFRLASVTKQFTAMAILILAAQGKLSVKDPICNYFADCPSAWQPIRIEHLLTHTSGIPDFQPLVDQPNTRATPLRPEQSIALFKDLPLDFKPGAQWNYSNSGYIVLGYMIEKVAHQSYEAFLQKSIFTPLHLHDTGYDHNSNRLAVGYKDQYSNLPADFIDMSIPYAAGGLYSTVEDLYRWEQALGSAQLVPKRYLDEMFAPHAIIPNSGGWAYGYGEFIGLERGRPVAQHEGAIEGFKALVTRYPNEQIVIIVLSNEEAKDVRLIHDFLSKQIFGDK